MPGSSDPRTTVFGGRLALAQPARGDGYRFNVDALLLARHAALGGARGHVVDLGAGVGAVGLAMLILGATRVTLVEREPHAVELARANAAPFGDRARVVDGDVAELTADALGACDAVVCNPPYTPPNAGRAGVSAARDEARRGDLSTFVAAAARLRPEVAHFVYPAARAPALFALAAQHDLAPSVVRWVHSHAAAPARIALVSFVRARARTVVATPWVERDDAGVDPALSAFLCGGGVIFSHEHAETVV